MKIVLPIQELFALSKTQKKRRVTANGWKRS